MGCENNAAAIRFLKVRYLWLSVHHCGKKGTACCSQSVLINAWTNVWMLNLVHKRGTKEERKDDDARIRHLNSNLNQISNGEL